MAYRVTMTCLHRIVLLRESLDLSSVEAYVIRSLVHLILDLKSVVALRNCYPHQLCLRCAGDVALGISLNGSDRLSQVTDLPVGSSPKVGARPRLRNSVVDEELWSGW